MQLLHSCEDIDENIDLLLEIQIFM